MRKAYGGVVINFRGQVLLREPASHYKGDVWTFAKGRPGAGESAEETALREVLEETGYEAEIAAKIPGRFDGKRTSNEYFLMMPTHNAQPFDEETQAIRWASLAEAYQLIKLNRKPRRRRRDLRVLKLAFALFRSLECRMKVSPGFGGKSDLFGEVGRLPGFAATFCSGLASRERRKQFEAA